MKYWRGYLVAAVLAVVSWALVQFAQAHSVLVDMIYPYVTRLIISSMAEWTGGMAFCLWQVLLIGLVVAGIASIVMMILLRWNVIQWFGWVLATISCVVFLHTALYGLNAYASPLADDVRLQITDYTVSELNEASNFTYCVADDKVIIARYYGAISGTVTIPETINDKTVVAIGYGAFIRKAANAFVFPDTIQFNFKIFRAICNAVYERLDLLNQVQGFLPDSIQILSFRLHFYICFIVLICSPFVYLQGLFFCFTKEHIGPPFLSNHAS